MERGLLDGLLRQSDAVEKGMWHSACRRIALKFDVTDSGRDPDDEGARRAVDLNNKMSLVTGAAKGIGRASALEFALLGAAVVVSDIDGSGTEATAEQTHRHGGGNAVAVTTDVTDEAQVATLIVTAVQEQGRSDILFNNAGGSQPRPTQDVSPAVFGQHGIRANIISPGSMDTAPFRQWLEARPGGDEDYFSQIPAGRMGSGGDIARVAAFLVSDYSAYVNGVTVPVDGGIAGLLAIPQT